MSPVPELKQVSRTRPYAKAPLEWHVSWHRVREAPKNLAFRLYVLSIGQGYDPPGLPLELDDDWPLTVCLWLGVHPRDRHNASRYLRELFEQGRIVHEQGRLQVLALEAPRVYANGVVTVVAPVTGETAETPPADNSLPAGWSLAADSLPPRYGPADVSLRPASTDNHSGDPPLKDRKIDKREIERAHAHEATPLGGRSPWAIGHDWCADVGVPVTPLDREFLEYIGSQPEAERQSAKSAVRADLSTVKLYGGARNVVKMWHCFAAGKTPKQLAPAKVMPAPRVPDYVEPDWQSESDFEATAPPSAAGDMLETLRRKRGAA